MSKSNPAHVLPVLASTAAELIDSALGKITEQAVADMLSKIAKLTAERDDASAKLAECRKVLDDICKPATTLADALFGDAFGPLEDFTPNQRRALEFSRDLERKLAACREALATIARVTGTSTEANKLARETLESTKP